MCPFSMLELKLGIGILFIGIAADPTQLPVKRHCRPAQLPVHCDAARDRSAHDDRLAVPGQADPVLGTARVHRCLGEASLFTFYFYAPSE